MDTSPRIAGALIGKAFFPSQRPGRTSPPSAPCSDIDIIRYGFPRTSAIVKYHRAITHSFVALPLFALLLAWLTCRRRIAKTRFENCATRLACAEARLIYAIAIASHSFSTDDVVRHTHVGAIFQRRVAWDILFIIDSSSRRSSCPQIVAWIIQNKRSRAVSCRSSSPLSPSGLVRRGDFGFPFHFGLPSRPPLIARSFPSIDQGAGSGSTRMCQRLRLT